MLQFAKRIAIHYYILKRFCGQLFLQGTLYSLNFRPHQGLTKPTILSFTTECEKLILINDKRFHKGVHIV